MAKVLPALEDLLLTSLEGGRIEVKWRAHSRGQETLRGYWLRWEMEDSMGLLTSSSMNVSAGTVSTELAHVTPGSRVCVSPIYRAGRGDGLCCTVGGEWTGGEPPLTHTQAGTHTHAHTRMHARTHTQACTHTCTHINVIILTLHFISSRRTCTQI